ncbi:hypothetical protein D3C80_558150 [compost metagenome]
MVHRHAPAKVVLTLEKALLQPLQTAPTPQPQQHLWRGGLPPFGCEAVAKQVNTVFQTITSRKF